jgi:hypothetical protein
MLELGNLKSIFYNNEPNMIYPTCVIHMLSGADNEIYNLNGDGALYMAIYGIACRLRSAQCAQQRSSEIQRGVLIIDCLTNLGLL